MHTNQVMLLMSKRFVLIGSGGHAAMLYACLMSRGITTSVIVTSDLKKQDISFFENKTKKIEFFNDTEFQKEFKPNDVVLINGIGFMPGSHLRDQIYKNYKRLNYNFYTLISGTAIVNDNVKVDEGVQICNGAIVNNDVNVGKNTIINSGCIVEHNASIGCSTHVCPGAILCGSVTLGNNTYIGPGTVISNGTIIGNDCIIGAGSRILKNVCSGEKFMVCIGE